MFGEAGLILEGETAMNLGLEHKVALVTGAASGIGAATARFLAREGARVLLADRNVADVESIASSISREGGQAVTTRADVTDAAQVAEMVRTAIVQWGQLNCAVNNAGIPQPATPLDQVTEEFYDRLMAVNAKGVWLCMKYEIPEMLRSGGGAIVNVASVAAHTATAGQAVYAGSKHAILGLTRGAALDCAERNIRVTAVSPGAVDTPMVQDFVQASGNPDVMKPIEAAHPMGRMATPDEVAAAIVWALSDRASFTTGSAIFVDGGFAAH
jgi:NAD(P)-dependent dehydrogenase (short-subunit alcohol dehydrogenase family)